LECVAAIKIKTCLYLQNKINLVSENIGNILYVHFFQLNKGSRELTHHRFLILWHFTKCLSKTFLEMGL